MATLVPLSQCIVSNGILRALNQVTESVKNKEEKQYIIDCRTFMKNEKDKNIYSTPSSVLDMDLDMSKYSLHSSGDYVEFLNRVCVVYEFFWNKFTKQLKSTRHRNDRQDLRYHILHINDKIDKIVNDIKNVLDLPNAFNSYIQKYIPQYSKNTCCINPLLEWTLVNSQ